MKKKRHQLPKTFLRERESANKWELNKTNKILINLIFFMKIGGLFNFPITVLIPIDRAVNDSGNWV